MVVRTLWCARCASGCSDQDRRHLVSALLALGWEQQTIKQAITKKLIRVKIGEYRCCPRNTSRSLGWPRESQEGFGEEVAPLKEA